MAEIKRRVKVFSYSDSNAWENIGTGFLSKNYIEVTQGEVLTITVWSELDNSIIIQSKVLPERSYKMQEVRWQKLACACLRLHTMDIFLQLCDFGGHNYYQNSPEPQTSTEPSSKHPRT